MTRLSQYLVDMIPEMGEDDIGTFAVNRPVSAKLAKSLPMVEDSTDLQWQVVQSAPRLGLMG
jgi:hypothetical protein